MDVFCNWVPVVDKHTCLRVFASQQLGEISGDNNGAQENIFDFQAAAQSGGPCVHPDRGTQPSRHARAGRTVDDWRFRSAGSRKFRMPGCGWTASQNARSTYDQPVAD